MKRFLAYGCLVQGLLFAGNHIQKANPVERCVRFEYRIINRSDRTQDVDLYLSLPRDNERQEISFLYPEPGYREIITDNYGNRIAHYIEKQVKPGEMRSHGWIAAAHMDAVVYQPLARPPNSAPPRGSLYQRPGQLSDQLTADPRISRIG